MCGTPHLRAVPSNRSDALADRFQRELADQPAPPSPNRDDLVLSQVVRVREDWVDCLGDHYRTAEQWMTLLSGRAGAASESIARLNNPSGRHAVDAAEAMAALIAVSACALEIHERLLPFVQGVMEGPG